MQRADQREQVRSAMRSFGRADHDHADSVWNRAVGATAQGDPFCCRTEWQLSYHEVFGGHRPLVLRESCGSVAAFAEADGGPFGPLLEPLESGWLFGCPLLGDHGVELLWALLAEAAGLGAVPAVLISGVLPGGALFRALTRAFGARFELLQVAAATQCSASLAGGFDGYLARRSGHFRRRLRQAERRALARGVAFERCVPRDAAAAAQVYARMQAIERQSWKGIGRCGMAEPGSREYYAVMLRRLAASGSGRVMFARCAEADIGFIFGGVCGGIYRGQQFSFADDWASFSIGNLLQQEQLRWLCAEGAQRYDMGPLMEYKHHWTELQVPMQALLMRSASGAG